MLTRTFFKMWHSSFVMCFTMESLYLTHMLLSLVNGKAKFFPLKIGGINFIFFLPREHVPFNLENKYNWSWRLKEAIKDYYVVKERNYIKINHYLYTIDVKCYQFIIYFALNLKGVHDAIYLFTIDFSSNALFQTWTLIFIVHWKDKGFEIGRKRQENSISRILIIMMK